MVKLNDIIQKKRRNKINTFKKEDGTSTTPGMETLDTLIRTHFPKATEKLEKKYNSDNSFSKNYIMIMDQPRLSQSSNGGLPKEKITWAR